MTRIPHTTDSSAKFAFYLIYLISGMLAGLLLGFLIGVVGLTLSSNLADAWINLPLPHRSALLAAAWGFGGGLIFLFERKKRPLNKVAIPTEKSWVGLKWGMSYGSASGIIFVDFFIEVFESAYTIPFFAIVGLSLLVGIAIGACLGGTWGMLWSALLQIAIKAKMLPLDYDEEKLDVERGQISLVEPMDLNVRFLKEIDNETSLNTILEGVGVTNPNIAFDIINLITTEQEAQATLLLSKNSNASDKEVAELIQVIKQAM